MVTNASLAPPWRKFDQRLSAQTKVHQLPVVEQEADQIHSERKASLLFEELQFPSRKLAPFVCPRWGLKRLAPGFPSKQSNQPKGRSPKNETPNRAWRPTGRLIGRAGEAELIRGTRAGCEHCGGFLLENPPRVYMTPRKWGQKALNFGQ